jgi:hypothetical protein
MTIWVRNLLTASTIEPTVPGYLFDFEPCSSSATLADRQHAANNLNNIEMHHDEHDLIIYFPTLQCIEVLS